MKKDVIIRLIKAIALSILFFAGVILFVYCLEHISFMAPLFIFSIVVFLVYHFILVYELDKNE